MAKLQISMEFFIFELQKKTMILLKICVALIIFFVFSLFAMLLVFTDYLDLCTI